MTCEGRAAASAGLAPVRELAGSRSGRSPAGAAAVLQRAHMAARDRSFNRRTQSRRTQRLETAPLSAAAHAPPPVSGLADAARVPGPPGTLRPGARFVLHAEALDAHGAGVGTVAQSAAALPEGAAPGSGGGGRVEVHVPGLLPGERATVVLSHKSPHAARAFATVARRHSASPERAVPACAGYGRCGGCVLQHMAYAAQLGFKRQLVADELRAAGLLHGAPDDVCGACAGSTSELGYRTRVKLVAAPGGPAGILLGAYLPRTHEVLDMAGCRVNAPQLTAIARTLTRSAGALGIRPYAEDTGTGQLRYVLLREVHSGAVQVSLVVAEPPAADVLRALTDALTAAHPSVQSMTLHVNAARTNVLLIAPDTASAARAPQGPQALKDAPKDRAQDGDEDGDASFGAAGADRVLFGSDALWEDLGAVRVRVSARSFLQVNREIAVRIYQTVADALAGEIRAGERILDLYCGVAGLGRTVLHAARARGVDARLFGIESSPSAVADAVAGAQAAGLSAAQAEFRCGAVESLLPELCTDGAAEPPAAVLLNPPRRGCTAPVLQAVIAARPRVIAYVSCNPRSLARDLSILCQGGYRLTRVVPHDMHPGTPHTESVAFLRAIAAG